MKLWIVLILMTCSLWSEAQHHLTTYIFDNATNEPLPGATLLLKDSNRGAISDASGLLTLTQIPAGQVTVIVNFAGYETYETLVSIPFPDTLNIGLTEQEEAMEEVVISSTRSSRTISDIPTRVEYIAGEELDEKANMKPGDIRMVLSESTGIQTQQTSATSANTSIRIQGLDGRYTQLLKDGFPLYSGAAGGLGLLQIAPLDLKQVEVIKGSASTLYGGGAIAGLVNLISKTPKEKREVRFHINGTSAKGLDINGFYSKRNKKAGTTIFAAHNRNGAYDPAGIDLSAIPQFERYTFNPRLFLYPSGKTTILLGLNGTLERRIGGDMHLIRNDGDSTHSYFEKNDTRRYSTQFSLDHDFGRCSHFSIRNSLGRFDRKLSTPGYQFDGTQYSSYTELNAASHGHIMEWIGGLNLWTEQFKEKPSAGFQLRDYRQITAGSFLQNTWKTGAVVHVETGLRTDYVVDYGWNVLPRISVLFKLHPKLSSRVGGGLGYKAPTIFTEESERIQYRKVLPISPDRNKTERSYGGNLDINYKTSLLDDRLSFSINQLFFYTFLNDPLVLTHLLNDFYQFDNLSGNMNTKGTETNIKIGYGDIKLFLGYTYTDTRIDHAGITRQNPLTAKHRINAVLMYEVEEKWKAGLESYYFSPQLLGSGRTGKEYVIAGFMLERLWEHFSLYINFENFLDARQTRFDRIYTGTLTRPVFEDIYAPLDGFVVNGGIKIKW